MAWTPRLRRRFAPAPVDGPPRPGYGLWTLAWPWTGSHEALGGHHIAISLAWAILAPLLAATTPSPSVTRPAGDGAPPGTSGPTTILFRGASDASAAVGLTAPAGSHFLVADDESNVVRQYDGATPGAQVGNFSLASLLDLPPGAKEADVEGAALVGERIYLITSHGRDRKGEWEPTRHRFGSFTLADDGPPAPAGRSSASLSSFLASDSRLRTLGLHRAVALGDRRERDLAPKHQGLNIEALAVANDGRGVWIGLRNPRPVVDGRPHALLILLRNPAEFLGGLNPDLGAPLLWDLSGLGLRALARDPTRGVTWAVAGPHDGADAPFALYRWSGLPGESPELVRGDLANLAPSFKPEAIVVWPDVPRLLLLSDDGAREVAAERDGVASGHWDQGRAEQKRLLDLDRRTFRGVWLTP